MHHKGDQIPVLQNKIKMYQTRSNQPAFVKRGMHKNSINHHEQRINEKILLMKHRYENGLDLWTGEPLENAKQL
jgi:hypothetical protein